MPFEYWKWNNSNNLYYLSNNLQGSLNAPFSKSSGRCVTSISFLTRVKVAEDPKAKFVSKVRVISKVDGKWTLKFVSKVRVHLPSTLLIFLLVMSFGVKPRPFVSPGFGWSIVKSFISPVQYQIGSPFLFTPLFVPNISLTTITIAVPSALNV